jgi:radical SAM superfamily enzyme YgiQ (UPF0313 family)
MNVHIVNPSDAAFGTAVITPRWMFVIAAATPEQYGVPVLCDETLEHLDPETIQPGDVVGIGIHTGNALRGYEVGRIARTRGAFVVYGGIHASLYPHEVLEKGSAHSVVTGDGDEIWSRVLADCAQGTPGRVYEGGRIDAERFLPARWDLLPPDKYMWGSVQTVRGCAKHCSFCSVWRTDGQKPRQRASDKIINEVVELRRKGLRFIALADDNFYPVTLTDIMLAERQNNHEKAARLKAIRRERFELLERLSRLPKDMVFFTQITMEAAEDEQFLQAMQRARIMGALVGVEAVTKEGLKSVYKDFNVSGENLVQQLQKFRSSGIHLLGSFIFGLPSDRPDTFDATEELARRAQLTFAQFVMLTPFPGTVDFEKWEKAQGPEPQTIEGTPITRYWLIPHQQRPKMFMPHPSMSSEELRERTQRVWDNFYSWRAIWQRSQCTPDLRARLAFLFVSKLYRQMYAKTGISTDSARRSRATLWARMLAKPTLRLFQAKPLPELQVPGSTLETPRGAAPEHSGSGLVSLKGDTGVS